MEDKTGKHPVTPGEVIPAREWLGEMLLELDQPTRALEHFEVNLKQRPNRFNAVYGAGLAAEKSGDFGKATTYFKQLVTLAGGATSGRKEINLSRKFLVKHAKEI